MKVTGKAGQVKAGADALVGVNYLGRPATTILAGALTHRNCYRR